MLVSAFNLLIAGDGIDLNHSYDLSDRTLECIDASGFFGRFLVI
jgi:hypothetical protein